MLPPRLADLVQVEHFTPALMSQVPRHGFDLYLNVDDGLRYHLPNELRPVAWWAIDVEPQSLWFREKALGCDKVFTTRTTRLPSLQVLDALVPIGFRQRATQICVVRVSLVREIWASCSWETLHSQKAPDSPGWFNPAFQDS